VNKHFYIVLSIVLLTSILAAGLNISRVAAQPVVDGVISPGEYAGGMAVQLVGPYPAGPPAVYVDAYIYWDTQYLWVAVDEPVPTTGGGTNDWIEFAFDAGPARDRLDAFVLFGSGQKQYVKCPKPTPPGGWGWDNWPHTWWAATNTETEFKIDYTDFGITFGDTIKMVIDRGENAPSNPPLGNCVCWPFTANFYPPQPIDPTTWGDVGLDGAPPPPHVVDGVIGTGEYAGGKTVQLVGRTDPTWTVDAYIDWDTQYLYVAVNEPVPPGGGLGWIEFAIYPGLGLAHGFALFDDGHKHHTQCTIPPGSWSVVAWPHTWWAATNTATEFKIDYTDFGIVLGDTIKLAIDRNDGTATPPPPLYTYGFAAFWPQNAIVYATLGGEPPLTPDPTTWGDVELWPLPVIHLDAEPPILIEPLDWETFLLVGWHEIWPNYCNLFHIIDWIDNGDGEFGYCDYVMMDDSSLYHVERVTVTLYLTGPGEMYLEFEGDYLLFLSDLIHLPISTIWHEVYPVYCNWFHILDWIDTGEPFGELSFCDYILLEPIDPAGPPEEWHVELVKTDIIVTKCPDFGDAPDPLYPSLLASDGARHLDWNYEWLGTSVNGEPDSKQVDLDEFDDGVSFAASNPVPGGNLHLTITISTSGGVYNIGDPNDVMYLNAWIDWNQDGDWQDADEKIIGTGSPTGTQQFDGPATPVYDVTIPMSADLGETWLRFRLDYAEDAGANPQPWTDSSLDEEKGAAMYGEVEDYKITIEEAEYTLTVNIVGSGSVAKSPDQPTYTYGTVVQLTATADPSWTFSSWSGDLTGSTNPDSVTMDGDKTVTATFTQETVSLTVVSAYDSPNPSGTTSYTPGTSVTASVTSPVAGPTGYRYVCTGWTGTGDVPGSGTGTTVTFTINQDSGITWNWKTQTYLTVKTDPPGIATIPGEGWYDKSTTVILTAPDVPGYVFSYWDVNGVSQGSGVNPISVQVDCTATAHYTAAPPPPPPPPVGGVWVPINKFELLAPLTGYVSFLIVAAASIVYVRRRKKKQT
jgi:hypothetical protein